MGLLIEIDNTDKIGNVNFFILWRSYRFFVGMFFELIYFLLGYYWFIIVCKFKVYVIIVF